MKRLLYPVLALASVATVAPAAPAAAEPVPDGCYYVLGGPHPGRPEIDIDGDGDPEAQVPVPGGASACVEADSGTPDPARFTCYGGYHECVLRITTGHSGAASAGGEVCVDESGDGSPLCVATGTGTVPLVPIQENTTCIGWSMTTSSCMYDD